MTKQRAPLRVAIAGLGTIGFAVACCLDEGGIAGMGLSAVSVRDLPKAEGRLAKLKHPPRSSP
jgi:aspartate dehydrogenase